MVHIQTGNNFLTVLSQYDLTDDTMTAEYPHQVSSYILNWKQQKWGEGECWSQSKHNNVVMYFDNSLVKRSDSRSSSGEYHNDFSCLMLHGFSLLCLIGTAKVSTLMPDQHTFKYVW